MTRLETPYPSQFGALLNPSVGDGVGRRGPEQPAATDRDARDLHHAANAASEAVVCEGTS
jgi:hypothetical protein